MENLPSFTEVLVVGAGPVGLMLAGELQRRAIHPIVIDQRPQPDYYCKALGITPRTLEVWDQIGVLEDALRSGIFTAGVVGSRCRTYCGRGWCTKKRHVLLETQSARRANR